MARHVPLFRHPPERFLRGLTVAAFLAAAAVSPAGHADPSESLEAVEKRLDAAQKTERALGRKATSAETTLAVLRQRSIAIAARTREHEATILELESRLRTLEARKERTTASLAARRQQLAGMLAALQRIAMHPPVALIALPTDPVDTVRSALLLRSTVPAVVTRARVLRDDLDALADLTSAVVAARARLASEHDALEKQRARLARLTDEKTALVRSTRQAHREAAERAAELGRDAKDLRDLMARLATERARRKAAAKLKPPPPAPPPERAREDAPQQLAALPPSATSGLPVSGQIDRPFGASDEFGQPSRGIKIRTRPGSTVVAPRDGVVVFAGPFRGLGRLLIIEYQAKYHLLLAGLARIDTGVGENVLAGEPVGTMEASQDAESALYMELRRNGQPINPLPWLAAGRTRVNG